MSITKRPNILLISMDSLRRDHLSCYGYERQTSPFIDKVSSEGTIYWDAIAPAGWTLPSHASLLTGMYPSKHGADDENQFLDKKHKTLAEVLTELSYDTVGFSLFPYVSSSVGLSRGFETFYELFRLGFLNNLLSRFERRIIHRDSGTRQIIRTFKLWLRKRYDFRKPFFAFVHLGEAHLPYWAPPPYRFMYLNGKGKNLENIFDINKHHDKFFGRNVKLDSEDIEVLRSLYDGEITYLDSKVKEIFAILRESEKIDNTIIILTADHGDNFGEHGLIAHRFNLYDSLIRIPLIIRFPVVFGSGNRIEKLAQLTDIFPTLLDILGIKDEQWWREIQGLSLLSTDSRKYTISEQSRPNFAALLEKYPGFDPSPFDKRLRTIRTKEHKFIWNSDYKHELYDLRLDPAETNNVISQDPQKAGELESLLNEWLNSFQKTGQRDYKIDDEKTVRKRLEELGYL